MKEKILTIAITLISLSISAQNEDKEHFALDLVNGLQYKTEVQASFSKGKTPLWLNANKYGLSSLDKSNGYLRAAVERPLKTDSSRIWGIGYGVDLVAPYNYTSKFIVQQAYAEARWWHCSVTVGSKQYPMEFKNNALSSGSQTFGINARPVPQVRFALPEYWTLPFGNGWLSIKGHIAYGMMTDDNWQHDFTLRKSKYADKVLYHSKAGYLKIGNEDKFIPFSLELGLEMACTFGGTSHMYVNNKDSVLHNGTGLKSYWNAFIPGGQDITDGAVYANIEGNELGSWLLRMSYDFPLCKMSVYAEKYFEDHSGMFALDYDGYGQGAEYAIRKHSTLSLYDLKDLMLGAEINLKYSYWINNIVFEYLYTKYQSGPVYHDHTYTISDHVAGQDNFYNHGLYTGWQHWGQVIGNPLYLSPIYNSDGQIMVENNRFMAFHLGIDGNPFDNFSYKAMVSYQDGLGTYGMPYLEPRHNVSCLLQTTFRMKNDMQIRCDMGADMGSIRGHNYGIQLTFTKNGLFEK